MNDRRIMGVLLAGVAAGALWGFVALGVNSATGVFPLESRLLHNLLAFVIAGALYGFVASGFLWAIGTALRSRGTLLRAIIVTTGIWLALRLTGSLLGSIDHHRFHFDTAGTVQGFFLSILLGIILFAFWGVFWKLKPREV